MTREHLTAITVRDACTTVDGVVVPDHPETETEETGGTAGKSKRIAASEAIAQAQTATLDELIALEEGETRATVLGAISTRREALTNDNGGANADTP